jgi:hypothetical protein
MWREDLSHGFAKGLESLEKKFLAVVPLSDSCANSACTATYTYGLRSVWRSVRVLHRLPRLILESHQFAVYLAELVVDHSHAAIGVREGDCEAATLHVTRISEMAELGESAYAQYGSP